LHVQNALKLTYSNVAKQICFPKRNLLTPAQSGTVSSAAMIREGRRKEDDGNQPPHHNAVVSKIDGNSRANPSGSKCWFLCPKRSKTHLNRHLSFQTIFQGLYGTPRPLRGGQWGKEGRRGNYGV